MPHPRDSIPPIVSVANGGTHRSLRDVAHREVDDESRGH
jgi:hypothetical protein